MSTVVVPVSGCTYVHPRLGGTTSEQDFRSRHARSHVEEARSRDDRVRLGTGYRGTGERRDPRAFFTGSVAKIFTATAVAQLVRQGELDPNADVNTYLRTFQIRNTYPGRPVTVADLLTHTAGFDDGPTGVAVADPAAVPALGEYLADHQPERIPPARNPCAIRQLRRRAGRAAGLDSAGAEED